jgi:predicted N-acetyltransferase YhbS
MIEYQYKKIHKEENELIESYNNFTQAVFGFDLENWRKAGYWKEQYFPNTFVDKNRVIANISACIMELQVNNENIQAIQLGAVGVLKEYRGRGLAGDLMKKVLEGYKQYPLIFLFASDDVEGYYEKYGFRRVNEVIPYINVDGSKETAEALRITMESEHIKRILKKKLQHSSVIDARNNESIYWFHMIYNFCESIYYIEEKDIVFIADYNEDVVNLYDVMSEKEVYFDEIKNYILKKNTRQVKFHFTPDWLKVNYETMPNTDNALYVYGKVSKDIAECRFPCTAVT